MKKSKFLVASFLVAVAITLASCGGGNTEKKTVEANATECEHAAKDSCATATQDSCATAAQDTCNTVADENIVQE